jgi:hypothetical protein
MRRKKRAMWPFNRKAKQPKFAPPRGQVQYVQESSSGFRYRLLNSTVDDGYAAAAAQLLPGEMLYRMMDGEHRIMGKLFPVLMDGEVNFGQSVAEMQKGRWRFQLAAGIPATSNDEETRTAQAAGVS